MKKLKPSDIDYSLSLIHELEINKIKIDSQNEQLRDVISELKIVGYLNLQKMVFLFLMLKME
jgi:hypothetical protein